MNPSFLTGAVVSPQTTTLGICELKLSVPAENIMNPEYHLESYLGSDKWLNLIYRQHNFAIFHQMAYHSVQSYIYR
ncbi:hypothetical protein [Rodentibacter caecimuris]|uniref:hypothetical protein n=1 Tax=Rodentibacter caecimuris TaxID=1796644 RepID=UPI003AAE7335